MTYNGRMGISEEARPGVAPDSSGRPAGTMFAALYGELAVHPWRDAAAASQDPYSLFHHRSLAMGWLTDTGTVAEVRTDPTTGREEERRVADVGAEGLWDMHEAGPDQPGSGPDSSWVAWFQVGTDPVPADRPLPVHPFLCCAGDVVAQFGTLRLQTVQVLLPVQDLHATPRRAVMPSLHTIGWFSERDPGSRAQVRVTVDSGQEPAIAAAAPEILSWLQRDEQDAFVCDSYSLADHDPLPEQHPAIEYHWNGPSLHRATFRGTLVEWSLDAVGWLAGFLADASARHDVTTPLLLTASRAD